MGHRTSDKVMNLRAFLSVAVIVTALSCAAVTQAEATDDPLAGFAPFIGGQWHMEGSYTELEWGVGRRAVNARSYFVVDGQAKLVSEGFWYWHPGEQQIKGVFTAIDMPVELFLYTIRFDGDTMIGDLMAYGSNGKETPFVEKWKLEDGTTFLWTLTSETPDGQEQSMRGTYKRQ